jgi:hypothetical protein
VALAHKTNRPWAGRLLSACSAIACLLLGGEAAALLLLGAVQTKIFVAAPAFALWQESLFDKRKADMFGGVAGPGARHGVVSPLRRRDTGGEVRGRDALRRNGKGICRLFTAAILVIDLLNPERGKVLIPL